MLTYYFYIKDNKFKNVFLYTIKIGLLIINVSNILHKSFHTFKFQIT